MTQYTQTILTLLILTIINVDAKTTGYRPEYLINTTFTEPDFEVKRKKIIHDLTTNH